MSASWDPTVRVGHFTHNAMAADFKREQFGRLDVPSSSYGPDQCPLLYFHILHFLVIFLWLLNFGGGNCPQISAQWEQCTTVRRVYFINDIEAHFGIVNALH